MSRISAGLLVHRVHEGEKQVFLVHPGGPFWRKRDAGAWTVPKGELEPDEAPLAAAQRELREETGFTAAGPFFSLGSVQQAGGKTVHAFAVAGDFDPAALVSAPFRLEWPPRSGRFAEFPEIDRGAWFSLAAAAAKINPAQRAFLERLAASPDEERSSE